MQQPTLYVLTFSVCALAAAALTIIPEPTCADTLGTCYLVDFSSDDIQRECCNKDESCQFVNKNYAQCVKSCPKEWEQCGGKDYKGPVCCENFGSGLYCQELNPYYSQCRKNFN
eukprot:Plantae.Rhodophyta-Palmaria_palmata.ctg8565.p1 GENE.Plantae.Rhodophyta-Palmaria_palmata.ctg8565~~Plantae.Rhodophyta-Palmaria_palmata.ctg8565.p1  ORF type:complete len:114 (+),score=5.22 Plantae.Rhodophyta-Palmaria_palmata.ctg8565:173-514(+)